MKIITFFRNRPRNLVLLVISILLVLLLNIQTMRIALIRRDVRTMTEQPVQLKDDLVGLVTKLDKQLAAKIPKSNYLIINSSANEFTLKKGAEVIREDKCSTGSYVLLKNGDNQQWMFKTPKGEFKILAKTKAPVWKKPDWAFVEEGLPVPSANHSSRFEYGVLGDYSMSIGNGYLIHGTLYQRFLGLPVTHGCVRLNDENLEAVYKSLQIGSKVYLF